MKLSKELKQQLFQSFLEWVDEKPTTKTAKLGNIDPGTKVRLVEGGATYVVMKEHKLKHLCIFIRSNNTIYSYPLDKEVILV